MRKSTFLALLALTLLAACQNQTPAPPPPPAEAVAPTFTPEEETAIKQLLVSETEVWIARDSAKWFAMYAHHPNSLQVWNNRDGSWDQNQGWANVEREMIKSYQSAPDPYHDKAEQANWVIQRCGPDWAWVYFDQTIRNKKGEVYPTKEIRMLQRLGGDWKIVQVAAFWDYTKSKPSK